jgi:transcriptional regulator with PAS, ATPase and Fis domain
MHKSIRPANQNEVVTIGSAREISDDIQFSLLQLEISARQSHITMDETVALVERQFVVAAIKRNQGNKCKAAKELGIHRNSVPRKIRASALVGRQIRVA